MSRIQACFEQLKAEKRAALIPYLTGGDPHPKHTVGLMHSMVAAGADILEIGVPFSDPMADGPTIQLACERALEAGTRLKDVLAMVSEFRQQDQNTPVVLMGYLNPIEARGAQAFASAAKEAGVDGVLAVDLAVEEADSLAPVLREAGLDPIFLMAPTTSDERVRLMDQEGRGYLYYVSLKGVTGSAELDVNAVSERVQHIQSLTDLPVAVGFGIRNAESAAALGAAADAVIVGSALVEQIGQYQDDVAKAQQAISEKLSAMAKALRINV